ncbi:MAG: tRNA (N(6)-L-threonylcarbamoyladenosine(37)-C(2))-methylthiotransferase MtaB [Erysipelotrichaceae bacterium]
MNTFAIATLGCKVNAFESESYLESLTGLGYAEVDFRQPADVYIINTCCVTNTAASKSRQRISQAQRTNPQALICVVGCYVQTHAEELKAQLGIDILVGAGGKAELAKRIDDAIKQNTASTNQEIKDIDSFEELKVSKFTHQTRAFLKIQDGCDQFCAYCIIPFARGRERSQTPQSVIEQAVTLSASHPEIVLAGIHTGRYGKEHGIDLTRLIRAILTEAPQLKRIRISSIEVTEITDGFIAMMRAEPRIARHLHIPIQAGCDATLQRMKRPYTVQEYLDRIAAIRQEIPDISISTDLIVGFPQEDEDEFLMTLETMKKARFAFMHVFPYSKRADTAAADMPGQNDPQCKKQRVQAAQLTSSLLHEQFMRGFIGKKLSIIIEETDEDGAFGHSSEYIPVRIKKNTLKPKESIEVRAVALSDGCLIGEES